MDDFRKRYDVPRRDYGTPAQRPPVGPPVPTPAAAPIPPTQPLPYQAPSAPSPPNLDIVPPHPLPTLAPPPQNLTPTPQATTSAPIAQPYQAPAQPQPQYRYAQPSPTTPSQAQPQPATIGQPTADTSKSRRRLGWKVPVLIAGSVILLGIGYILIKPSKSSAVMPSDLAKQASFSFYYPDPLPAGYAYDTKQGTYQSGNTYYMLLKGGKHIIISESASTNTTKLGKLNDSTQFDAPIGTAIVGTNTGQTAGFVLAGTTLITIHSNGSVPKDDIKALINNLKIIGQPAN